MSLDIGIHEHSIIDPHLSMPEASNSELEKISQLEYPRYFD